MKGTIGRTVVALVLVAGLCHADDMLHVTQDESSMERSIAEYLRAQGIDSRTYFFNGDEDDEVLLMTFADIKDCPPIDLRVDTLRSATRGKGRQTVTERCVKIYFFYILPDEHKTPAKRAAIAELNRSYMAANWMPHRVYLDRDNDLAFEALVNVPGVDHPVPAEAVHDLITRMLQMWESYYPLLAKELRL